MSKSIPQVAMLIAVELEVHHASLALTRLVVALDPHTSAETGTWYRVAIGQGMIGVTEGVAQDELYSSEGIIAFVDRIVARLYDALARAHEERAPVAAAALPDVQ